jgi:hypothetical protein
MDAETFSAIRRLKPDGRSNLLWHNTKTGKDSFPSNARKAFLLFNKTLDSLCHFVSFEQTELLNPKRSPIQPRQRQGDRPSFFRGKMKITCRPTHGGL